MKSTTTIPLPVDTTPIRDQVSRTYSMARILSGFTDDNHFHGMAGDYLNTLSDQDKKSTLEALAASRVAKSMLTEVNLSDVISRALTCDHISKLQQIPAFQNAFGAAKFSFAWIKPSNLIAIQAHIKPRKDSVPTIESDLLEFALPTKVTVPAEVTFTPPQGPIHIISSSPNFHGVMMQMNPVGFVTLGPPPHLNLIQVRHFNGRYYLMNGYHRVADCIRLGILEIPALIIDAGDLQDMNLGPAAFGAPYLSGLKRPPLIADFSGPAAIDCKLRERRYGVTVTLDIKPINIGI